VKDTPWIGASSKGACLLYTAFRVDASNHFGYREFAATARALVSRASFGPETVAAMTKAFDHVWAELGADFDTPLSAEAARLTLASAILATATTIDGQDVETFKAVGRTRMAAKYPWLIDLRPKAQYAR
jgi:hypothetical protein